MSVSWVANVMATIIMDFARKERPRFLRHIRIVVLESNMLSEFKAAFKLSGDTSMSAARDAKLGRDYFSLLQTANTLTLKMCLEPTSLYPSNFLYSSALLVGTGEMYGKAPKHNWPV